MKSPSPQAEETKKNKDTFPRRRRREQKKNHNINRFGSDTVRTSKKIGIIMGKIYKDINRLELKGMLSQAYSAGYSAYVFTMNEEYFDEKVTEGEKNLLNVINFSLFDGFVYLPYTFSKPDIREFTEEFISERYDRPVICTAADENRFERIWFDDCGQFYDITTHVIQKHGCKKLLCLTGHDNMQTSLRRAEGFRKAAEDNNIEYYDVVFGDFWVNSAAALAEELYSGRREFSDAVICANDIMAVALCRHLIEKGINVPDDIIVTGYDGTTEAGLNIPSVTTYQPSWESLGARAVSVLCERMTGESILPYINENGCVICGESCGCKRTENRIPDFDYEKIEAGYMDSSLSTRLLSAVNFSTLIRAVYETTYTFADTNYREKSRYCLCLCDDWSRTTLEGYSRKYRTEGYSSKMLMTNMQNNEVMFPLENMVPYEMESADPSVIFFTAAHFRDRCFGYSLLQFMGEADGFDIHYQRFCREVNNALEFLCLQNDYKSLAYRNFIANSRDDLTGLYIFERCPQMWEETVSLAELYGENIYIAVFSLGGLRQVEDTDSRIEKDRIILSFAEILLRCSRSKEKVFKIKNSVFAVVGSEMPPMNRPAALIKSVTEIFREQNKAAGKHFVYTISSEKIIEHSDFINSEKAAEIILQMYEEQRSSAQPSYREKMYYAELAALHRDIFTFPENEWGVEMCCKRLNVSRSYFQKIYRNAFGTSCISDIQLSKLNHAKKLLVNSNLTLQDIASRCGYEYSHFMRIFKKDTSMTPTEYRRGKA